jgi:hypothetical protein
VTQGVGPEFKLQYSKKKKKKDKQQKKNPSGVGGREDGEVLSNGY